MESGLPGDMGNPAGPGSRFRSEMICGPDPDTNLVQSQIQNLASDLAKDRVGPCSGVRNRRRQQDLAVLLQLQLRVRISYSDVTVRDANPSTDVAARLAGTPPCCPSHCLQSLSNAHLFQGSPRREFIPVLKKILHAELVGVDPQLHGHHVHLRFHGEDELRIARTPDVATGNRIRVNAVRVYLQVWDAVATLGLGSSHDAHVGDWFESSISSAVKDHAGLPRNELSLPVHSG